MCGIIGYVGGRNATELLVSGLENLEYRGYDSAGVALKNGSGVEVLKRQGEVDRLKSTTSLERFDGNLGLGHTRWSTHGPPTDANAHPHTDCTGTVAVVHNGIIDNHDELRDRLEAEGHEFTSETDTEVIPHLVETYMATDRSLEEAFRLAIEQLSGSYAVAMIVTGYDSVYASRSGSPLVLGVGKDEFFLASDVPAFLEYTESVVYLDDGDVVELSPEGYTVTDAAGEPLKRAVETVDWTPEDAEKGGYEHYMLKEIHEQPTALEQTIRGRVPGLGEVTPGTDPIGKELSGELGGTDSVLFVACGTSYHAALYGEQLLADRDIDARTMLASEFVANPPPLADDTLVVGVTQSGETADTLAALRTASQRGHRTLAITNVVGSTAARECDDAVFIRAGPEIGVAATKTFSSQIATLVLLAAHLAGTADESLLGALAEIPDEVAAIVDDGAARRIAETYRGSDAYFFIGRGVGHPVALEGALKLKEISYEHAEGFPAGELKHGPLALVTPETPVFAILTGEHEDKMRGTIEEVTARGAPVIAIGDPSARFEGVTDHLPIADTHPELAGILANVQLQLFAYHTATMLDRPVDKPRNLAKSVTVE